jgi:hypothetical protein
MQSNFGAGILIGRAGGEGSRMTATWRTQGVRNTKKGKLGRLDDSHEEDSGYTKIQHQRIPEVLSIIKFSLSFWLFERKCKMKSWSRYITANWTVSQF